MGNPFTIDLQADTHLLFRIDAFSVPLESRCEFEATMHRNLRFIAKLPGFVDHMAFEKSSGPTSFDIVTIAVWKSAEAIEAAGERVAEYYSGIGFDLSSMLARLGIIASLGYYRAPAALQSRSIDQENHMQAVTVINHLTIKPGKIDELLEAQRSFAASLTSKPSGLLGSRTYRSLDGKSVVLVSQFESIRAQEEVRQAEAFKLHLKSLQSFVENSNPGLYEEVSTTGKFI